VTVAAFNELPKAEIARNILEEAGIQELGSELFALVELDTRKSIRLNFTGVEFLSSAALGKLITLDRKTKTAKGGIWGAAPQSAGGGRPPRTPPANAPPAARSAPTRSQSSAR
jgi:hypothetical protein